MEQQDIRILIVDDEPGIRFVLTEAVADLCSSIETAQNGADALELCKKNRYDVVITDLMMPEINGITLLKKLKSRHAIMEIVVITGYARIETAIEAMKYGAYDFITKPVDLSRVQQIVTKCIQNVLVLRQNAELQTVNARLLELNELKDRFFSITNHEIRTPLTIIKGYLDILYSGREKIPRETNEIVSILKNTTDGLIQTMGRVHSLSMMNRLPFRSEVSTLDLTLVVEETFEEMKRLFESRNIAVKMSVGNSPSQIYGHRESCRLMLRELLQNSLKYTPNGGAVSVALKESNDEAHLLISDTGIGIPLQKQDLIFNEFYEVQNPMHHSSSAESFLGGGIGIGLSLVQEIVNSMQGTIALHSEPGTGTTFEIRLPIQTDAGA